MLKLYNSIFTPSYHYSAQEFYGLVLNWRLFHGECFESELLEHADEYECGTEIEIDANLSQAFHAGGKLKGKIIIDSATIKEDSVWSIITGIGVGPYEYTQSEYWKKHAARADKHEPYKPVWSWTWGEFNV